ncbi:MAG: T9SS type A sorting domain-containing protein, partial [Paludibacter sp.]
NYASASSVATAFSILSTGSISTDTNVSSLTLSALSNLSVAAGNTLTIDGVTNVNSVVLAPKAKLTLSSGTLTSTNGITLESDANGTATLIDSYETPTITATVQQHVTLGRNWYLSSPVSTASYTWLSRGTSVQGWDEAAKAWVPVTTGTLVRGKGYVQVATSTPEPTGTTGTVNVTGTTNSGDVAITVSRTESGTSRGFNLVGNPYPSYLKWNGTDGFITDATNDSISTSFWYRTKNSSDAYVFTTYNGSSHLVVGGSTVNSVLNEYIPPMQAFWIRVDANATVSTHNVNLTFKNNMRVHGVGDNNKFKAPKADGRQLMRLQLENGTQSDEALIYFDADAANSFDNYDSPKMMNNSTTLPDLYSTSGSERLVINGLNEVANNMELPLGFTLKAAATGLKLKVSELSNFASGTKVYLLDKEQNAQIELLPATEYTFNTTASTTNNESRFSLLFRAPEATTGVKEIEKCNTHVFVNAANQITIIAPEKAKYSIYNAIGQKVIDGVTTSNRTTSNFKLANGVYVVRVSENGKEFTTRVIYK